MTDEEFIEYAEKKNKEAPYFILENRKRMMDVYNKFKRGCSEQRNLKDELIFGIRTGAMIPLEENVTTTEPIKNELSIDIILLNRMSNKDYEPEANLD